VKIYVCLQTPLHTAAELCSVEVVTFLLQRGADTSLRTKSQLLPEECTTSDAIKALIADAVSIREGYLVSSSNRLRKTKNARNKLY